MTSENNLQSSDHIINVAEADTEVFYKKGVSKYFAKFTGNTCDRVASCEFFKINFL